MALKKLFKLLKKGKRSKKKIFSKPKKKKRLLRLPVKKKTNKKVVKKVKKSVVAPKKEKPIGVAVHYFSNIGVAVLKLITTLKVGDRIQVKGFTTDFKQTVSSLQIDHIVVDSAQKGKEVGIRVKGKVRHGDKVYKI